MKKLIILNIDGGGVFGLIPLYILKELEELAGKDITEIFDVYSGVSAGAILVAALNIPKEDGKGFKYTAASLTNIFVQFIASVFHRSFLYKIISFWGLIRPIYEGSYKDKAMHEFFGNVKLSDLKKTVNILTTNVNDPGEVRFGTKGYFQHGKLFAQTDFYLKDVVNASSAAPVFFPSVLVNSLDGELQFNLVDGGLMNNTQALTDSVFYENFDQDADIHMLSLGTHVPPIKNKHKRLRWGLLQWGTGLMSLSMAGRTRVSVNDTQLDQGADPQFKQFLRFSPETLSEFSSGFNTNPKYLAKLEAFAKKYAKSCAPKLQEFLDGIAQDKRRESMDS
jgi:patatin-like phospholipase/acyl hydrolase